MHGVLLNQLFKKRGEYSPIALFKSGEQGVWYDPSDHDTLYQDAAGTTPVTSPGDPVGLMLDKSQGLNESNDLTPEISTTTGWFGARGNESLSIVNGKLRVTSLASGAFGVSASIGSSGGTRWVKANFEITKAVGGGLVEYRMSPQSSLVSDYDVTANSYTFTEAWADITSTERFAGVIAVSSGTGQYFELDLFSVVEVDGNHAYQTTSAARPLLGRVPVTGRRNLYFTTDLTQGAWTKDNVTISSEGVLPQTGDILYKMMENTNESAHRIFDEVLGKSAGDIYSASVYVRKSSNRYRIRALKNDAGAISYNGILDLNTVSMSGVYGDYYVEVLPNDLYRVSYNSSLSVDGSIVAYWLMLNETANTNYLGDGTSHIFISSPQIEIVGNLNDLPTAYQKVVSDLDVTEQGVRDAWYLQGDGVDDSMTINAVTFATQFSIVTAAYQDTTNAGVLVEQGGYTDTGFALGLGAFSSGREAVVYDIGSTGLVADGQSAVVAMQSQAFTAIGDSTVANALLRKDGLGSVFTAASKAGAFGGNPMRLFTRSIGGAFFDGRMYGLVVVDKVLNESEIGKSETYMAQKSGATLA